MSPSPDRIRRRRARARALALALAPALALALVTTATLGVLWRQGVLKPWLQARAVDFYVRQVQPHLPFEIEEVEADAPLRELLRGRIKSLSTTLRWQQWRMRLSGPIEITRPGPKDPSYSVKFDSQATLEPVAAPSDRSAPFGLDLYAKAPEDLSRLTELELYARAKTWEWKRYGLSLQSPDLAAAWKADRADVGVSVSHLRWEPSRAHRIELGDASASAETPLKLKPLEPGPDLHFNFKAGGAQALWDQTRLQLPLDRLPIDGHLRFAPASAPELTAQLGPINLQARQSRLSWKTPRLRIRELIDGLLKATGGENGPFGALAGPDGIDVRGGMIQSEGTTELRSRREGLLPDAHGLIRIEDGALQLRRGAFAARGIRIELPFSTLHGTQAIVSASDLFYKKAHARLDPTDLSLEALGHDIASPQGFRIRLGPTSRDGGAARVPLAIDEVPLELGTLTGTVLAKDKDFDLATSLKLAPVDLEKLTHPLCVKNHSHLPPARIEADLSRIALGPGMIDPDGKVTAHLFDGEIRAEQIGFYDLGSEVPEVDFDLEFEGIQLEQLCAWSGFGEMIGSLQGSAHDVTFQGWLPTHFDFRFDAVPRPHGSSIEMDPEAMHNLVSLFAGDALDRVPVIAHGGLFNKTFDPYFGWLSRRLAGFDLGYFGLSLFSSGGTILLETHDPPDIYRIMKKHYIFWGHRFKMPVQSEHYPVVMDEHGIARIFQLMVNRAKAIAQAKRDRDTSKGALKNPGKTEENDENENDPDCLPPVF